MAQEHASVPTEAAQPNAEAAQEQPATDERTQQPSVDVFGPPQPTSVQVGQAAGDAPAGSQTPAVTISRVHTGLSNSSCSIGFQLTETNTTAPGIATQPASPANTNASVRSGWSAWRFPSERGKLPSYVQRAFRLKAFSLVFAQLALCLAGAIAVRELDSHKLIEEECTFEANPNTFAVGDAGGEGRVFDLNDAMSRCIELKAACNSITCETSNTSCRVRVSPEPVESIYGETTYVKSCSAMIPPEYFWLLCALSVICILLLYYFSQTFPVNYLLLAVNTVSTALTWSFGGMVGVLFKDAGDLSLQVLGVLVIAVFVTAVACHLLSHQKFTSEVLVPTSFLIGWLTGVVANIVFLQTQGQLEGTHPWVAMGITFLLYGIVLVDVGAKLVSGNPDNFMRIVVAMDSALLVVASIPFLVLSFCLVRSFRIAEANETRRPGEARV